MRLEPLQQHDILLILGLSIWPSMVRVHLAGHSSSPVLIVLCLEFDICMESSWNKENWMKPVSTCVLLLVSVCCPHQSIRAWCQDKSLQMTPT